MESQDSKQKTQNYSPKINPSKTTFRTISVQYLPKITACKRKKFNNLIMAYNQIPLFSPYKPLALAMKKIVPFLALFLVFAVVNSFGQSKEDIVYLNNGSILRGKIVENERGVRTSIEILGHNLIVIPDSAIKMILMDQKVQAKERENSGSPVEMNANINFYGGSENSNSGGLTFVTSYKFPIRLSVGVGIGMEWFEHQQIPFLAETKYYFLQGSFSPFVYAHGGYAVPMTKKTDGDWSEYYGGWLTGTGGGLRLNFSKRNALVFSFGYRYQKTKTLVNSYPWMSSIPQYETTRYDTYNRLAFSFGFLFN